MGQSGSFAPVNRKLLMPPTYHPWIEGFPPMCANEREGKSMRVRDFLARAGQGSLNEKTETRHGAPQESKQGATRNSTP